MVRTVIYLSEQQAAALERVARRRGVSRAAVVRQALAEFLDWELETEGQRSAPDRC